MAQVHGQQEKPPEYSEYPPQPPAGYRPYQQGYGVAPGYQQGGPYQAAGAPPGYQPIPTQQPTYMIPQGTAITVQPQSSVVVVGGCPACRVGVLEDDFTCLGVCCAIFFFPIGILCCLAMRQRRCPNCGAVFS